MSKNLNDAAMAGNLKEVEMRLNMGEDVNQTQFPRYTTALHDATACGRTEVARLLIKRYANVRENLFSRYRNFGSIKHYNSLSQGSMPKARLTSSYCAHFSTEV